MSVVVLCMPTIVRRLARPGHWATVRDGAGKPVGSLWGNPTARWARRRLDDGVTEVGDGWTMGDEQFIAGVLRVTAQPLWVVDPEGLIRFANPAAVEALGYDSPDELLGRHSHE